MCIRDRLYKDWLLLRRQLWYYALLLGLYLALTAAGVLDASFLCGLAVLYGTLLPVSYTHLDVYKRQLHDPRLHGLHAAL